MARAPFPSIALPAHSPQPSINRRLRRWLAREFRRLQPVIEASAAQCQAERYRKHFSSFAHACLLIFHGLARSPSLRQSYPAFAACTALASLSGLAFPAEAEDDRLTVGFSQFAASNTTRPAAFLAGIIPFLLVRVAQSTPLSASILPPNLHLIDSTFLRLSLKLAPWLPQTKGNEIAGVRLQVGYIPALDVPEHVVITTNRKNDCLGLDQLLLDDAQRLAALRHHTLVFDLGYYSHRRFAQLRAAEVHLVTRLHPQAAVRVEQDLPVQHALPGLAGGRIQVLSDQRVTVGSAENSSGAVLPGLRLVTAQVQPLPKAAQRGAQPVVYRILTDRWDLTAQEAVQIYLWRWAIELFFRWLKSEVHLPRLLGYSRNAVELTVWLSIVIHLLTVLAARALGLQQRSPTLFEQLRWALATLTEKDDSSPVEQLSFPGWAPNRSPPT